MRCGSADCIFMCIFIVRCWKVSCFFMIWDVFHAVSLVHFSQRIPLPTPCPPEQGLFISEPLRQVLPKPAVTFETHPACFLVAIVELEVSHISQFEMKRGKSRLLCEPVEG